jgi:hypothetical protein
MYVTIYQKNLKGRDRLKNLSIGGGGGIVLEWILNKFGLSYVGWIHVGQGNVQCGIYAYDNGPAASKQWAAVCF